MKREGRQHGMVRCYELLPPPLSPKSRVIDEFQSPPTAGLHTKSSTKPSNHSKFTGKCGRPRCKGCHIHPVCKSKDKTKGTQKLKSYDVATNHRLVSWRVVDKCEGLNYFAVSATGIVGYLSGSHHYEIDNEISDDHEDVNEEQSTYSDGSIADSSNQNKTKEIGPSVIDSEDDDGDDMGFYTVGLVWDTLVEDQDWCLVGEM